VYIHIIDIILICLFVFLSCESDESFIVYIYSKRITTCNESVYPHIELKSFIKERVINVALHNALPVTLDFSISLEKYHAKTEKGIFHGPDN
jgi:hypothetical protein